MRAVTALAVLAGVATALGLEQRLINDVERDPSLRL